MNIRRDIPASLVVFLVAVPLALGIALAPGAPVIAGLIGAVVGGIVTDLLAGAPLQVSGPAAGLTVVVFGLVQQLGWETVCLATACAGLVQLLLGYLKVARGTLVIAPSVVHGMLAGIGFTVALFVTVMLAMDVSVPYVLVGYLTTVLVNWFALLMPLPGPPR